MAALHRPLYREVSFHGGGPKGRGSPWLRPCKSQCPDEVKLLSMKACQFRTIVQMFFFFFFLYVMVENIFSTTLACFILSGSPLELAVGGVLFLGVSTGGGAVKLDSMWQHRLTRPLHVQHTNYRIIFKQNPFNIISRGVQGCTSTDFRLK